ncbi:MAG: hypothetical protein JW700_01420 [Candidatus Aenigmarchaeota archaeon]|nr:hypothetical protein [Candidatus Aenigmarchaeota archaeon]
MQKYLNVLEYSTRVEADKTIMDIIDANSGFVLPDLKVKERPESKVIGSIKVKSADGNSMKSNGYKDFLLNTKYGDRQRAMDATMLSSHLLEESMVKEGRYSFHSSAITDGNDAIVIGGSASSGKTTTMLSSCLKDPEKIKIYSGDRTVIDGQDAIAGTKQLCIRLGSLLYELPELKQLISKDGIKDPWDSSTVVAPEDLGLHADYGPRKIKYFVYPRKGDHELEASIIKDDRAILRLHQDICAFSGTHPNVILGQRMVLPDSELDASDRQKRLDHTVSLADEVPLIAVSGRLEDIGTYVAGLILGERVLADGR